MGLENFIKINDCPNYAINKLGQIKNLKTNKLLKPILSTSSYYHISLYNELGCKIFLIHILVANMFLNHKKEDGLVVNHKNFDKSDNRVDNLELTTQKDNIKHSMLGGKQIRSAGSYNSLSKKVYQYDLNKNLIKTWGSVMDIQRELGIGSNYVSNCALKKCKTSKGFIWSYEEIKESDDLSD